ncbi:ParA family protein [Rhizobium oryzicola]|uniref:ParA family protein n=1 Tax=Rhizobium oryzicola TaxID=1232668 RepID=A0ABT8T3R2_9HYPH|nr:ParA family protein [Rhizobium oryzicola]MDO1585326.1 ParA family protein [Rhizobium oryzicola]
MIISIANIKGGSGKTTSSALLVSGLLQQGHKVATLDCDPLSPFHDWMSEVAGKTNLSARATKTADIPRHLESFRNKADYIVVDLSAASDATNALTFALSDFVLVPMQGSAVDARGALHTLQLLQLVGENRRAPISSAVVLTRLNPMVLTHSARHVGAVLSERHIPLLDAAILERSAYRDMFITMSSLFRSENRKIHNLQKARNDILCLTEAVKRRLTH